MNKYIRLIPALAFGMAVLSIPTLATAATTINVVSAQLLAKGAGVLVSVEVTCDASVGSGSFAFVDVRLVQRAGSRSIQGFGSTRNDSISCDGTPQPGQVLVISDGNQRVFHQGAAIAQASAFVCGVNACESAQVTEEIQIVK